MMNGIEQLLISNIAAITTAGGFLVYLYKKSQMDKGTFEMYNKTIQNHLKHSLVVESKITRALQKLTDSISNLCDRVETHEGVRRK